MTSETTTKSVRAVERAIDVLKCFGGDSPIMSVTDLQRRLGLSRPTLYRLLHTLETKGMVRSWGEPQRFELDVGVAELAGAWLGKIDVSQAAQPFLAELWDKTDETVALFVRTSPFSKICVNELRSRKPLTFTRGAGFTEPTTVGSSGKVMIAFMRLDEAETALGELRDARARAALDVELAEIRREGFAISSSEILAGAIAIAAPVFDSAGAVVASVCLFGPEARLRGDPRETCIRELLRTAEKISGAIGFRPVVAAE